MVSLPANLMVEPPLLPAFPRSADGAVSGGQCLMGAIDLYAAAGAMRLQLLGLIEAEKARAGTAGNAGPSRKLEAPGQPTAE